MAINIKPSRKGLLHEKLGIPQGKKISLSKLAGAKQSKSPALRKEATFAMNARKWGKSMQAKHNRDVKKGKAR